MDAVLVNPAGVPTPEELQAQLEEIRKSYAALGLKMPSFGSRAPVHFDPTSEEDAVELFNQAMSQHKGSVLVFLPANAQGQRVIKLANELDYAPARGNTYFTIHRTGISRGGVKRNFGVSLRLANEDDALKLKVAQGDIVLAGYNVEVDKPEATPAT